MKKSCLCKSKPTIVENGIQGEMCCQMCGVVILNKMESTSLVNAGTTSLGSCKGPQKNAEHSENIPQRLGCDEARLAMSRWTPGNRDDAIMKRTDDLMRILEPMLARIVASSIMIAESVMLLRRLVCDNYAKGMERLTLCAAIVMSICRVYGRTRWRNLLVVCVGANKIKKVRHVSADIMFKYELNSFFISELTKRIISRMCDDINRDDLLLPAINSYESMARLGITYGKNPYVVAAYALSIFTKTMMSREEFSSAVGVRRNSIYRFAIGYKKLSQRQQKK